MTSRAFLRVTGLLVTAALTFSPLTQARPPMQGGGAAKFQGSAAAGASSKFKGGFSKQGTASAGSFSGGGAKEQASGAAGKMQGSASGTHQTPSGANAATAQGSQSANQAARQSSATSMQGTSSSNQASRQDAVSSTTSTNQQARQATSTSNQQARQSTANNTVNNVSGSYYYPAQQPVYVNTNNSSWDNADAAAGLVVGAVIGAAAASSKTTQPAPAPTPAPTPTYVAPPPAGAASLPCAPAVSVINGVTYYACGQSYYIQAYSPSGPTYMPVQAPTTASK